ncbi:hypothetical protein P8452_68828 [Trifolium repens]|nr:hypothetical protein P8452_68828 [Trifolium repens]
MLCMLLSAVKDPKRVYEARGRKITKKKGNYSFRFLHIGGHITKPKQELFKPSGQPQYNCVRNPNTSIMSSTSCRSACRSRSNSLTLIREWLQDYMVSSATQERANKDAIKYYIL